MFYLKPGPPRKLGPNLPETRKFNIHCSSSSFSKPTPLVLFLHQKPHFHSLSSSSLMALSLSRPKHRSITTPSLIHLFSSSSSLNDQLAPENPTNSQSDSTQHQQQQPSFSSYFSDVKASLRQNQQQNPQAQNQENKPNLPPIRNPTSTIPSFMKPTSKVASLEEIRKNLSEFRRRSSAPPPTKLNSAPPPSSSQPAQTISFQELYKRNVLAKQEGGTGSTESTPSSSSQPMSGKLSFDAIRESLRQMQANQSANTDRSGGGAANAAPFSAFKNSLKLRPMNENEPVKSTVIGGTQGLPMAMFGKEMEGEGGMKGEISTEFVKMYSHGELGEKLRLLRPEVKKGEKVLFSLGELNERLRKLREMEEKETESRIGGVSFKDLRESLVRLRMSDDEKAKKNSVQRLNLLGQLGAPNFMLQPPKEQLVEKYFHPDNMSSVEKLKIELAKVRDEFKMSESDCGSARVQVAQLTAKIKHLSSVLHKKDKHSRKGLLAMVQKRKTLLKYLRRTDWDSYCFVLSKLGLRDNPDGKGSRVKDFRKQNPKKKTKA